MYDFAAPLGGGTTCSFEAVNGVRSVAGVALAGQHRFTVDAGGPVARAVLPIQHDEAIEEDQVFLVAANMPPLRPSVATHAYCAVDGVGEKMPVDVLAPDLPGKLLAAMGTAGYQVSGFLGEAGLPTSLSANAAVRARALAGVVALKCRRPLPPGRDVALVWSGQIAGAGGKLAGADQRRCAFPDRYRSPERSNSRA